MSPAPSEGFIVERRGDIFVITLQNGAENRLNSTICQNLIRAFHYIQRELGPGSPGAVITRGNNHKHWCTGVDLSEGDTNPFASSDGFYPVAVYCLRRQHFPDKLTAACHHPRLSISNDSLYHRAHVRRRMPPRTCSRLPHHEQ